MKIVVTGPFESGKSTIIHNITNGNCINVEVNGTTIAMDHGVANINGMNVFLFGTPGLLRFTTMRKILSEGADGLIFVVDSSDPESDARAKLFFREVPFFLPGVPCVVAANKQDIGSARPVEELQKSMSFVAGLPMIPCSGETGQNVDSMLRTLLYLIMMQWSSVFQKFAEHSGKPNGLELLTKDLNISKQVAVGYLRKFELRKLLEVDVGDKRFVVQDNVRQFLENPVLILKK